MIRSHMDAAGIENLEKLHRRFLETSERGLIPVPGRHRGKPVKLPEFREHVTGRHPYLYAESMRGLVEIFGLDDPLAQVFRVSFHPSMMPRNSISQEARAQRIHRDS